MTDDAEYGLRTALLIKLAEQVETLQRLVMEQGTTDSEIQRIIGDMQNEIERLQRVKLDRPKWLVWLKAQWIKAMGVVIVGLFAAWTMGLLDKVKDVLNG